MNPNLINRESILKTWNQFNIKIKYSNCSLCNAFDLVQHQNICVECMVKNAQLDQKIKNELKDKCAMCGNKLTDKEKISSIPYLKNNVCDNCLKLSFNEVEQN